MRTRTTLYNAMISIISQLLFLILSIIFPRLIIIEYGSEVNGLTTSINQILNIVNLLQAGVVGASIYDMYRPISEEDNETVGTIYYSSKKYFNKVSVIFFLINIAVTPMFLINSIKNISNIEMLLSVLLLTINGSIIFRYISSYDIIISAHQKKYILAISSLIEKLVYYVILLIILHFNIHFIFMYIALICGTVTRIIYLRIYFDKEYKIIIEEYSSNNQYKVKNQYYLLSNQIVQQIIESAPTLIITLFHGLTTVSVFSLYNMIVSAFKMVYVTVQNSIAASFGDLSISNKIRASSIFDAINLMFINLGQITSSCMIVLCLPFISLYTTGISDANHINRLLAILMSYLNLSYCIFMPFNMAINSNGEYKSVAAKNIMYGVIFTIMSIVLSSHSFTLCVLPFIAFYVLSSVNRIFVLKEKAFYLNVKRNIKRIVVGLSMPIIYYFVFNELFFIDSWMTFVIYGTVHLLLSTTIVLIVDVCADKETISFIYAFVKEHI